MSFALHFIYFVENTFVVHQNGTDGRSLNKKKNVYKITHQKVKNEME